MVHSDEKQSQPRASVPDVKAHDPVPDPNAPTLDKDIARAEGEGMLPAPIPETSLPKPPRTARRPGAASR